MLVLVVVVVYVQHRKKNKNTTTKGLTNDLNFTMSAHDKLHPVLFYDEGNIRYCSDDDDDCFDSDEDDDDGFDFDDDTMFKSALVKLSINSSSTRTIDFNNII